MNPEERRKKILDFVRKSKNKVTVKGLSLELGIPQSLAYKDIGILESQRLLKKKYGSINIFESEKKQHNFFLRLQKNEKQKKAIAKKAVSIVCDGDTIFLDGSTTVYYFFEELKRANLQNITLITNSIFIPQEMILQDNIDLICVGGVLNKYLGTSDGDTWEMLVKNNIYANKFFFSCFAMSTEIGVLDPIQVDASMKSVFSLRSQEKICLLDSSKFFLYSANNWIGLDEIDLIISDSGLNEDIKEKLSLKDVKVLIAD